MQVVTNFSQYQICFWHSEDGCDDNNCNLSLFFTSDFVR